MLVSEKGEKEKEMIDFYLSENARFVNETSAFVERGKTFTLIAYLLVLFCVMTFRQNL